MKNVIETPDEKKLIITEGIDYLTTGNKSIWGEGDKETLEVLKKYFFGGKWLNLAAGDGRYNNGILTQADEVTATDIDQSALVKLETVTPDNLKNKLKIQRMNLLDKFPFNNNEFDGVFCVGTLHLFPEDKLKEILDEINRVTKKNIFIDFATDISRLLPDGTQHKKPDEIGYTIEQSEKIFKENFLNFNLEITRHKVPEETVNIGDLSYVFKCNYILVRGVKKSS
jgi:ubiquinone/menaquinone biosynthesis C-methylase UbiE